MLVGKVPLSDETATAVSWVSVPSAAAVAVTLGLSSREADEAQLVVPATVKGTVPEMGCPSSLTARHRTDHAPLGGAWSPGRSVA
nr:hypothetical protein [Micromonospora cremea]